MMLTNETSESCPSQNSADLYSESAPSTDWLQIVEKI